MKLLVTGGAGYIGSVIASQLLEAGHEVYNLGNGEGFSVRQVIEVAREATGREIRAVESPRRPGDPPVLVASSEKIRRELGWSPRKPGLAEMVSDAWGWMLSRPEGYGAAASKERA